MPVSLDAQAGRRAVITIKPDVPGTAAQLSALSAFLTSCTSAGLDAVFIIWPLPYNCGLSAADYKAAVAYYGPSVRSAGYKLAYNGGIWPGTGGTLATFTAYYPGPSQVDLVLASYYSSAYNVYSMTLADYAAVADADGLPFGLAEMGVETAQSQSQGDAYMAYVQSFFTGRAAAGKTNGDLLWADTAQFQLPAGSYLVADWQALYDAVTRPPPASQPAVTMYGAAGTFAGLDGAWRTPDGRALQVVPVDSWGFGAGEAVFYTLAMSDGQIVLSTVPLTASELSPTADHGEIAVFDPARNYFYRDVIPTSTGKTTALPAGKVTGGTDVGGGDMARVTPGGTEKVLFTCGGLYFNWDLSVTGQYPGIGYLAKPSGTDWAYDAAASKTATQLHDTNPTAWAVISALTAGTGGNYYPTRLLGQVDVFPQSGHVVVGHYFGDSTHRSGVISVWDQNANLKAAYQVPDMNRQDGATAVTACPREVKCDPSSAANDERFAVIYDVYGYGGNAQPVPNHVIQEFTYNAGAVTVTPKSVPWIGGGDDTQPGPCWFTSDGTLYVGGSGQNTGGLNALTARNMDVYLKTGGERRPVTDAPATTGWATDGRYATKVRPDFSLGFPVSQGIGGMAPLAFDSSTSALLCPGAYTGLLGAAVKTGSALGSNLLTGDDANFEGGTVGSWAGIYTTVTNSATYAHGGTKSMRFSSGYAQASFAAESAWKTVTPGREYWAETWMTKDAGAPTPTCKIQFRWKDASGALIGADTTAVMTVTAPTAGTFVRVWGGAKAPRNADQGKLIVSASAGSNFTAGQSVYSDDYVFAPQPYTAPLAADLGASVMKQAYPQFIPGRPAVSGGKLWVPWGNFFSPNEQANYDSASTVPDTLHPQFLQAVDIALLLAGLAGSVSPPPEPPPPPPDPGGGGAGLIVPVARRDWHFVTGPASGGHENELAQASDRKVTFKLTDGHEAQFAVNAAAGYDAGIGKMTTDLHVIRGGQPLYRGRVTTTGDQLRSGGHTAAFGTVSYRGILYRRILWGDSQLRWGHGGTSPVTYDVADIVWGLITQTQKRAGGDLGIIKGQGFPALGWSAWKACEAGDKIAEKIDDLAYVSDTTAGAAGFDWDISPRDAYTLTCDLWPVARGADRQVYLQYGDTLTGPDWDRSEDTADFATALRMTGQAATDSTSTAPVASVQAADIAIRPEGRWDAALQTEETSDVLTEARALLQLSLAQVVIPSWTIPLRPGAWDGPAHIWLGDTVHVVAGSGRLTGVEHLRVLEMPVILTPDGEQVSLTVGQPRPDLRRKLARLASQIARSRQHSFRGRQARRAAAQ